MTRKTDGLLASAMSDAAAELAGDGAGTRTTAAGSAATKTALLYPAFRS
jgi:hypothetical protein